MTLNDMAYQQGNFDALSKFAALGQPFPAAGALSAVPPIAPAVPGTPAAAIKPGAPNQALPTSPVLGTGVPGTPTIAGMGKPVSMGAAISSPAPAAPATPTTKAAGVYAPVRPPKAAKIPVQHSTIGSNNTIETVQSAPKTSPAVTPVGSVATATTPGTGTDTGTAPGIVTSTGTPPTNLANETASNLRNQTVATSGGGK